MSAVADRLAIQALLDHYPFLVDQGRYAELSRLFTSDGVMEGPVGRPGVGTEGIEQFFRASASKQVPGPMPKLMRHHVTSRHVEVDGDTGQAQSYFMALSDSGLDHWGRYRDTLLLVDGHWLIQRRTLKVDGCTPGSWWERNVASEHQ
jgi:hypothetical protein